MPQNLIGKNGRLFGEQLPGADESAFQVDNTSNDYYNSPYYKAHQDQIQPVPTPRSDPPRLQLADIVNDSLIEAIQHANKIVFHAVGDTGAAKGINPATEATVADLMAADVQSGGVDTPSFFFHLGDVVYYFGESQYYYDQFYEPLRAYDRPIFAIPGNHDGMVSGPNATSLEAFKRNFCAEAVGPSPDAGSLVRSVMTQPGVYFTLDAPFVSIIGLYSNVLDGPGVISSQGGRYVGDEQTQFLTNELERLKPARMNGERAIVLAVHHPPLSIDSKHGGTKGLFDDIDACCKKAGLWPDVVLSGHAHLYQRFSRSVDGHQIPYIVSGSGGFAATRPQDGIAAPYVQGDIRLACGPLVNFGYLLLTVDMTNPDQKHLAVNFNMVGEGGQKVVADTVTVSLAAMPQ
jgi:calcineurin-like phosphoesterase family protein